MKAVILAGGLGTRLSEETDVVPKPMVKIGGRPILWHIMKLYSHAGVNDFIICLGYKGHVIKEYFSHYGLHNSDITFDLQYHATHIHREGTEPWRVTLIDSGDSALTGNRLRSVREHVEGGTFCFTYGDGLSNVDIAASIRFHQQHGKHATVTAVRPPGRFGVLKLGAGGQVTRFAEKENDNESLINGGFFVLEPQVFDAMPEGNISWEREPVERLTAEGQLMAYIHKGFWQPMDTLHDKRYLERLWESGSPPWKCWHD